MISQKEELNKISDNYIVGEGNKHFPTFELFLIMFSISLSILLFISSDTLDPNGKLYSNMLKIMSQNMWALSFFVISMLKAVGLLFDKRQLRYIGISASCVLYFILFVCYFSIFPSLGSLFFFWLFVFSGVSIPLVKKTGIK